MSNAIQDLTKPIEKHLPKIAGTGMQVIATSISGVGFDQVAKVLDNFIGSPLQRFGISLPIVGRISVINIINYFVHNKGKLMPQKDLRGPIAVAASIGVQTGFNLGNISGLFAGTTIGNGGNSNSTVYAE